MSASNHEETSEGDFPWSEYDFESPSLEALNQFNDATEAYLSALSNTIELLSRPKQIVDPSVRIVADTASELFGSFKNMALRAAEEDIESAPRVIATIMNANDIHQVDFLRARNTSADIPYAESASKIMEVIEKQCIQSKGKISPANLASVSLNIYRGYTDQNIHMFLSELA